MKHIHTLIFICIAFAVPCNSIAQQERNRLEAASVFAQLDQSNNYTRELSIADLNVLPMGLSRTLNNINYSIAVSRMVTTPDHVELTVFGRVKLPQGAAEGGDKILFFGAQGIKMSYGGNMIGEASLSLFEDVEIPVNGGSAVLILKGNYNPALGYEQPRTTLTMDCQGFKSLSIDALLEFPETLIRPVDARGNTVQGRVSAGFRTVVEDWNNLLLGIDLPAFAVTGLDGFVFQAKNAVFDFSDIRNENHIKYPDGYREKYLIAGYEALWRGVYISNLYIQLPAQFESGASGKRAGFEAQHMILDNNGISGAFSAVDVLPIDAGNAGGWRFSVDRFSLTMEANHLTGAGFGGFIGLPVASTDVGYEAFISPANEYFLKVNSMDELPFDMWRAQAKLLPNSYVAMTVKDHRFVPEAMLHGSVTLKFSPGSDANGVGVDVAKLDEVTFREMHLQTEAPYFTVAQMGYSGTASIKGFPLSIGDIRFTATGGQAQLAFDTDFAMGDAPFTLTAGTRLAFVAEMRDDDGRHSWKYKECSMTAVRIDASIAGVFTVAGEVTVMNSDPVYGDGFAGNLKMKIEKGLNAGIDVSAVFGKKDFRYWLIDGTLSIPGGIPIYPPVVNLTGFGGGAYYRMKPGNGTSRMPTGCSYIPDAETGLGLKASVLFNIGADNVANGEAMFEIAFNRHGGVNFIGFFGQAKILAEIPGAKNIENFVSDKFRKIGELEEKFTNHNPAMVEQLEKMKLYEPENAASKVFEGSEELGQSGFAASIGIKYDFQANSLHANFNLYINAAGGVLKGASSGNRAGWAVLHIDPNEWYMHMGTPTNPLGVIFDLAGIVRVQTGSYFMIGDHIPASPPPPAEVARMLGVDARKLDDARNLNALKEGRGFAFGANLSVETGDITFLILYANFKTGLGFDIMLSDEGNTPCVGRTGVVGLDGWRASGQAYAYLQGELGVNVNLLFVKKKIPVIKGGAAVLLQAQLPNPAWFAGYLGVQFDLLGGLVSGRIRMKIELGQECKPNVPGGSPLGVDVISDMTPRDGSGQVDVFAAPQAAFNMRIGQPFEVEDDEGIKRYRLRLEEFAVYHGNQIIEGQYKWSYNNDMVSFYSKEVLPPNASLRATARISFEEYKNNSWMTVYTGGQKAEERRDISFATGDAPDVIPESNIEYAYPVLNQRFFYPGETSKGYIQLKRGQSYLFSSDMTHQVRLTSGTGVQQSVNFIYSSANDRIDYTLPVVNTNSSYQVEVVSFTKKSGTIAGNADNRVSVFTASDEYDVTVRSVQAGTETRSDVGKTVLGYSFSTSSYQTFADKVNGIQKDQALWGTVSSSVINLQYSITGGESFDLAELIGSVYTANKPLVQAEAALTDAYFRDKINPLIYRDYSQIAGVRISHREPLDELGVPPAKALYVGNSYLTEVEYGNFNNFAKKYFPYIYNLPQAYYEDYKDLSKQAANRYTYSPSPALIPLVKNIYPYILYGNYQVILQYMLPGEVKGTRATFDYHNPIR